MIQVARVPFPSVPYGEISIFRRFTAPGLFAHRHMQSLHFLSLPDFGGGDMTAEQRRLALDSIVNVHQPMAAVALMLGVVALEDFIRELGARLADVPELNHHFPAIGDLRPRPRANATPYARPDTDACNIASWTDVNSLYSRVIEATPIREADLPKLHDLALIRHTVAHHAALVRRIDAPRFQHWEVQANSVINPPVDFIREMLALLYSAGRQFENAVRGSVLRKVMEAEASDWKTAPSQLLVTLIETFNWFGYIVTDPYPYLDWHDPQFEKRKRAQEEDIRAKMLRRCLDDLGLQHAV